MLDAVIDLSHHNGPVLDFQAAAAGGTLAVIHKATQGPGWTDPTWASRRAAVLAAGLAFGSYHFGEGGDGAAQAEHFLATVGPRDGELVALDLEANHGGSSMSLAEARAFVGKVRDAIGKFPVLYGGETLRELLGGHADPVLSQCPLWLAQYGPEPKPPVGWSDWSLWQYSDGVVGRPAPPPGIGPCDRDRFNGEAAALAAFWTQVSP